MDRTGSSLPWELSQWLPCDRCARIPSAPGAAPPCRCAETVPPWKTATIWRRKPGRPRTKKAAA